MSVCSQSVASLKEILISVWMKEKEIATYNATREPVDLLVLSMQQKVVVTIKSITGITYLEINIYGTLFPSPFYFSVSQKWMLVPLFMMLL